MIDLPTPNFPRYHLTHYNGSKKYMIMVLSWDVENGIADGWMRIAEFDTIRECREYMKRW
jgi:hypothetical protein